MSSLAGGDVVELVLHVRGELQVEDLGEVLDQEVGDDHPQVGGDRIAAPSVRRSCRSWIVWMIGA